MCKDRDAQIMKLRFEGWELVKFSTQYYGWCRQRPSLITELLNSEDEVWTTAIRMHEEREKQRGS